MAQPLVPLAAAAPKAASVSESVLPPQPSPSIAEHAPASAAEMPPPPPRQKRLLGPAQPAPDVSATPQARPVADTSADTDRASATGAEAAASEPAAKRARSTEEDESHSGSGSREGPVGGSDSDASTESAAARAAAVAAGTAASISTPTLAATPRTAQQAVPQQLHPAMSALARHVAPAGAAAAASRGSHVAVAPKGITVPSISGAPAGSAAAAGAEDVWVPPAGQSGDGRTALNDALGY